MSGSAVASIYFGWRVVAGLFLCTLALYGVSIYAFIVLSQPMAAEFGWSPLQTGTLVSAMYLVAPIALFAGPITARVRPWRLIVLGLSLLAIGMLLLAYIDSIGQLYAVRVLMGLGKVATAVAVPIIVSRWFARRFASAMAVVWAGGAAGGFLLSPLTESLATTFGWRHAAMAIGALTLALVAAALLLARGAEAPAARGLPIDGDDAPTDLAQSIVEAQSPSRIALPVGLAMMSAVVGAGVASLGLQAQEPAILACAGFSPAFAALLLGLTAAGALAGSATIGPVLDRRRGQVGATIVALAFYGGLGALFVTLDAPSRTIAVLGALLLGYAFGAGEVMWITFTRRQFGAAAFPVAYGGFYFAIQLGYALGGSVGGWGLGRLGPAGFLALLAAIFAVPTVVSFLLRAARARPMTAT